MALSSSYSTQKIKRVPILLSVLGSGAAAMDCWNQGYGEDYCCNTTKHGPRGNGQCWDEFYTPDLCCSNIGENATTKTGSGFGCGADYFRVLKMFSSSYMISDQLNLPGILSWGVVMHLLSDTRQYIF